MKTITKFYNYVKKYIFSSLMFLIIFNCTTISQTLYNKFIIGTFHNPHITVNNRNTDIAALNLAKDMGINILTFPYYYDPRTEAFNDYLLDIAHEVGLNYVINDDRHMINSGWNSYTVETFNSSIADLVTNHYTNLDPSLREKLYGYRIKDEPSPSVINSSHLPVVQSWINHFRTNDNSKYSLVNLLPMAATSYNNDPDFQTKQAYESYLDEYLNNSNSNFNTRIASIDNYLSLQPIGKVNYFYNLNIFVKKSHGRPMWGHVDINRRSTGAHIPFLYPGGFFNPDESYIRFSVNSLLAYGFKGIIYFPYENPVLDYGLVRFGIPTTKYYWVQKLNNYIKNVVGPAIMRSHYIGTYHKGNFIDKDGSVLETISNDQILDPTKVPFIDNISHPKSMVGLFYDNVQKYVYLYVVNKGFMNDHGNIKVTVTLKGDKRGKIFTTSTNGPNWNYFSVGSTFSSNHTYFVISNLKPGEGRLFRISNHGFGKWDEQHSGYGDSTYHPVPADYDGDGKADLSVKTDGGYWKIDYANNGFGSWDNTFSQYGASDAHPVPADYDGDGKTDLSIKADWGTWYINYAKDGFIDGWDKIITGYGNSTYHPVPADYDGDGKADLSVKTEDNSGDWKIDYASNGFGAWDEINMQYGTTNVTAVPADYDGNGKADLSIKADWGVWFIDYEGYEANYNKIKVSKTMANNYSSTLPKNFSINNYPNPFNPTTKIAYTIPQHSFVTLEIFDVLGKKVKTLVEGYKELGTYSVTFDAEKFSSGTYIYLLRSGNFIKAGKMLLMK